MSCQTKWATDESKPWIPTHKQIIQVITNKFDQHWVNECESLQQPDLWGLNGGWWTRHFGDRISSLGDPTIVESHRIPRTSASALVTSMPGGSSSIIQRPQRPQRPHDCWTQQKKGTRALWISWALRFLCFYAQMRKKTPNPSTTSDHFPRS